MAFDLVKRTTLAVAAACLAVIAPVLSTVPTTGLGLGLAPASAEGCPDIEVVFARGTNEAPGLGLPGGSFVEALRSKVGGRSVGSYAVAYPADYDFLAAAAGACPGKRAADP